MANVTDFSTPTVPKGSPFRAFLYGTIGACGLVLNIFLLSTLPRCKKLHHSAMAIFLSIYTANIIGLLPKTFYSPAVAIRGYPILEEGFLKRVPGAMVTTGVYFNLTLVACMALNRFAVFKSKYLYGKLFTKSRSRIAVFICLMIGSSWGVRRC